MEEYQDRPRDVLISRGQLKLIRSAETVPRESARRTTHLRGVDVQSKAVLGDPLLIAQIWARGSFVAGVEDVVPVGR